MKGKNRYTILLLLICVSLYSSGQDLKIVDNVTDEDLLRIRTKAMERYGALYRLKASGPLAANAPQDTHILFDWPLRSSGDYDDVPNYYMIQNYVDDDNSDNVVEYNCGNRAYNLHNGTDINPWPFWWHMMDRDYVYVVAAAPGIVIDVFDGYNNDQNCSCIGNNNVVTILHADSSVSIYYHIKDNSALVNENDIVWQGQPIATVGSSGCSSNPHLHFEVRDKNDKLIDPWIGPNPASDCNNRKEDSWWINQKPYWEPQVNRVMTHSAQPSLQGYNSNNNFCPFGESVLAKNNFAPGETVFIGIAMHDYLNNTSVSYTVSFPNGTVVSGNNSNTSGNNNPRQYLVFSLPLPSNAPAGTYRVDATYQGIVSAHYFSVNCIANYSLTGTLSGSRGYIASNTIQSDATLPNGSKIKMQAANNIQLNPGFTAVAGTVFKARIKDCNYTE